jgi:hypothetical protein
MPNTDRFHYENPRDSENEINVYIEDDTHWEEEHVGKLVVEVADEQAVDSYNSVFNTSIHLPEKAAKKLRDFLLAKFPL